MQALEHAEQLLGVLHVEAVPVVGDLIDTLAAHAAPAHPHAALLPPARELERVVEQIHQHVGDQEIIAACLRHRLQRQVEIDLVVACGIPRLLERLSRERVHVDLFLVEMRASGAVEAEQPVEQRRGARRAPANPREHVEAVGIQRVTVVLEQQRGEIEDRAERRFQIVRERVGQRLELGGAFLNARLEILVEAPQRFGAGFEHAVALRE